MVAIDIQGFGNTYPLYRTMVLFLRVNLTLEVPKRGVMKCNVVSGPSPFEPRTCAKKVVPNHVLKCLSNLPHKGKGPNLFGAKNSQPVIQDP